MKWLNTLIPAATIEQANMRPLDEKELADKIVAQKDEFLINHYEEEINREKENALKQR